ncbi:MAG: cell division protein FtsQ/DivIB [Alphaproteobacteria bacterium]|nr:cell division protein FtsQ/DivIB [Alphaproteobacteria bacterium]
MSGRARVKVKQKRVTRAEAAAEFSRKKARQRRQHLKRRALMVGGVALLAYGVAGAWWLVHTGQFQQAVVRSNESFWRATASLGFRVDQVTLHGRQVADRAAVKAALGVTQGAPILALSLADMQARLMAIPEVRTASITRTLPNRLAVTLRERTPAAWWQKGGVQTLIDADGKVLSREKYGALRGLPVVVGADAPAHIGELLAMLDAAPGLRPEVVAAVRVGDRRWNIQLAHAVVVLLPEENPALAWQRFARLVEKEALLSKAIRSVDMRMEDRVFIMPVEQKENSITLTTARDT